MKMDITRRKFFKYSGAGLLGAVVLPFLPKIDIPVEEDFIDEIPSVEVPAPLTDIYKSQSEYLSDSEVTRRALEIFHNKLKFIKTINRQYDERKFGKLLALRR